MAELYNMQRYLSPNLLDSQGVSNFSAWAKTFGEVTETLEPKPEGGGLDIKRRFARFQNLPELMSSFHCYSDIMTADDLDLDLPELESHAVAVPATPEQLAEVEALVERGEKVHAGCDPSMDNMLKITGDGRKVALDPKLLYLEEDPDMEPLSGGKVDACVRNILDIRRRTEAERGAQLVFVDSSTPASGRWNIQDDVRRRLIEAGVPESEIACVTDAKGKSKQKEALYEKVRSGDIRILLGSTTTLGTGTNVQTRLAAIHDLDCPWRPSDLEQRLGRIVRQGNGFDHVHDFRYVSTGTFDSYLYSIVERKQRFISQVFTNKSPVRTMDDLDETVLSLAQMKQIAEGDPTVAERMDVENKIGQLKLMMASHLEGLADVQHKIETQYRPLVEALTSQRDMLADARSRSRRRTSSASRRSAPRTAPSPSAARTSPTRRRPSARCAAPPTASAPAARRLSEPTAAFRSCAAASTSSTTTGCPISAWRSMPPNTFTCRTGSSLPERKEHSPCLPRWTASSPGTRRAPPRSS